MPSSSSPNAGDVRGVGRRRARGHRAVVVRRRLRQHPDRAGRQHPLAAEQQQVRVDHAGRVHPVGGVGGEQRAGRVPLAADVVAVQPDADVEAPHRDVGTGNEARPTAAATAAAGWPAASPPRRSPRPARPGRPSEVTGESARTTTTDRRSQSVSRIVTGVSEHAARRGEPPGADPGERRVPGDVDPPVDQVRHLPLVVRVQDVIEVEAAGTAQPGAEPVPDRDDLRVVGDRAEQDRPSDLPEQRQAEQRPADEVLSASVVGAITRAARESRKSRSTTDSLRNAAPPPGRERQVGRVRRRLARRRLHLEHEQHARPRARSPPR